MGYSKMPIAKARKVNNDENGEVSKIVKARIAREEKEKDYVPLMIKKGLVILVPKNRCNEEYRQEYLRKIDPKIEHELYGMAGKRYDLLNKLTKEKLQETSHLSNVQAAKELGVSKETIRRYRKDLLNG